MRASGSSPCARHTSRPSRPQSPPRAAFADYVPHDSVGSRGTADIPQTNEKYLCFHGDKDSARREECQIYRVVLCRRPSKKRRVCTPGSLRACNPGKPGLIPCRATTRPGPAEKAQAGAAAVILPAGRSRTAAGRGGGAVTVPRRMGIRQFPGNWLYWAGGACAGIPRE